jgi:hypothetical protein
MTSKLRWLFHSCVLAAAACAGHSSSDPGSTPPASSVDHGAPSDHYPAFTPAWPQIVDSGGKTLAAPRIVGVTFAGDPLTSALETFLSGIGGSAYWKATTAEYGIGAAQATMVQLREAAPATTQDPDIVRWLAATLSAPASSLPAPDDETAYVLFYPEETAIIHDGQKSCTEFGAYHGEVTIAGGRVVPYVVVPRCTPSPNAIAGTPQNATELLTVSATHEIVEVATDPFPLTAPAWLAPTDFYGVPVSVTEVANMCDMDANETMAANQVRLSERNFSYLVERTWSNAAAIAGKDPCVPSSGPYFGAAPVTTDVLPTEAFFGRSIRGFEIPAGQTRDVEVDLLSDGPTGGPFTVTVEEIDPSGGSALSLVLDRSSGVNGEKLHLAVTVISKDYELTGFRLRSTLGNRQFVWYGLVHSTPK